MTEWTDTDLANACVALGVGKLYGPTETQSGGWAPPKDNLTKLVVYTASDFVRDWRVAGAMMEKCIKDDRTDLRCVSGSWMSSLERFDACVATSATPTYGVYLDRSNESLPRAIIEATVEALT